MKQSTFLTKKLKFFAALLLSPVLSFATPVCDTSDANFCGCFVNTAISNCLANGPKHHIPRQLCSKRYILPHIRSTPNISGFCSKYSYMFPAGATHQDCVDGVSYAKSHC